MKSIIIGLVSAFMLLFVAAPVTATNTPNEGVCPNYDTGHLSADDEKTFTYPAPSGFLITTVCVKAGSINQGNGPETIVYDPPVASATFSHSSGKDISHFSVDLVPEPVDPPKECPDGDYNGEEEEGCGEPPVSPPVDRCPPGEGPYKGKDGKPGNQECCPDDNNNQVCDEEELPPLVIEPPVTSRVEPVPPPSVFPPKRPVPKPLPKPELKTEQSEQTAPESAEPVEQKLAPEELEPGRTLPRTGVPLGLMSLLGAALSGSGLWLRRRYPR